MGLPVINLASAFLTSPQVTMKWHKIQNSAKRTSNAFQGANSNPSKIISAGNPLQGKPRGLHLHHAKAIVPVTVNRCKDGPSELLQREQRREPKAIVQTSVASSKQAANVSRRHTTEKEHKWKCETLS